MTKKSRLVCGVGVYEHGKYRATVNRKVTREYNLWRSMLSRCYGMELRERCQTYIGCSVSNEFLNFQGFMVWAEKQSGFGEPGYHLDKDILLRGNKVYSPDTCAFVPQEINNLLTGSGKARGQLPIGVCYHKVTGKYSASVSNGAGVRNHIGLFTTASAAFAAYKTSKECIIRCQAEKYKEVIDIRVYEALSVYDVSVMD